MIIAGVFVLGRNTCSFKDNHNGFSLFGERGKGELVTVQRTVSDYTRISSAVGAQIEWQAGETWALDISAQQNILDLLKTEVKDNTLKIYFDESVNNYKDITIRITSPSLEGVAIAGSGDFIAKSLMQAEKISFDIGGAGSVKVPQLKAGSVDCDIAGSGDVDLGGEAQDMSVSIAGSGTATTKSLSVNMLNAEIAGSGDIYCTVKDKLKVSIAGSGSVHYSGEPSVESHIAGSGDLIKN
jgi:Putative auto-transporter adhesin, head GIN domain